MMTAVCPDTVYEDHRFEQESITAELIRRGYVVHRVSQKNIVRRRPDALEAACGADIVYGDIEYVQSAMRAAGIPVPATEDYPDACMPWLKRHVWKSTLQQIPQGAVFVKPADKAKKFTGVIIDGGYEPYRLQGVGRNTHVWYSQVVDIVSEWRVYLCRGEVLAVSRVPDDDIDEAACLDHPNEHPLDMDAVHECVAAYCDSGSPDGYVIDFGMLRDGDMVLVEVNDGYAFGIYSRDAVSAAVDVMIARWRELKATVLSRFE